MLGDARRVGHHTNEFIAPIHRLHGRNAKLFYSSLAQNLMNHGFESQRRVEIAPPTAQVNSRNDDLAISGADQRLHLVNNSVERQRPALPAHIGNYAERATVVAAVLHLEIGTRALVIPSPARGIEH